MKVSANMLNKDYEPLKVRALMLSLHNNPNITSEKKWTNIKRRISKDKVISKLQECIFLDIDEAIDYLSQKIRKKQDNYTSIRKEWLKMLKFAKKNHKKLTELYIIDSKDVA